MSLNPYEPPSVREEAPVVTSEPRRNWAALIAKMTAVAFLAACLYWLGFGILGGIGFCLDWNQDASVWWMLTMLFLPMAPAYKLLEFTSARWETLELWDGMTVFLALVLAIGGLCIGIGGMRH